jgi:uncharacterized protein (TIGR00251 family)
MTPKANNIAQIRALLAAKKKVRLKVKVTAGGGANSVTGTLGDDTIKIRISAAPEKGKANKELLAFLANTLEIQRKQITIVSGHTSPSKIIDIFPS